MESIPKHSLWVMPISLIFQSPAALLHQITAALVFFHPKVLNNINMIWWTHADVLHVLRLTGCTDGPPTWSGWATPPTSSPCSRWEHSQLKLCVCVCVCARLCGSVCLTELKNEYTTDKSERRKLPMEWSMSEWPWATDDRGTQEGPQPSTRPSADSTESKGTIHLSPAVVTKGKVKYTFPHSNHLWKKKVKCVNVVLCLVESVGYMKG